MYTNITRAMSTHNKIMMGERFTTLDAAILNLVKSFSDSNTNFYFSNQELGDIMVADPQTVQRSINKLLAAKLITKHITHIGKKTCRVLTYDSDAVNELLELQSEMHSDRQFAWV